MFRAAEIKGIKRWLRKRETRRRMGWGGRGERWGEEGDWGFGVEDKRVRVEVKRAGVGVKRVGVDGDRVLRGVVVTGCSANDGSDWVSPTILFQPLALYTMAMGRTGRRNLSSL